MQLLTSISKISKYDLLKVNQNMSQKSQEIKSLRLSYEILADPLFLQQVFKQKIRDEGLLKKAIKLSNITQFDNEYLVKEIRIKQQSQDISLSNLFTQQKSRFLKIFMLIYLIMGTCSIAIQSYYYLEYDVWLTSPAIQVNNINMDQYFWLNQPKQFTYSNDTLEIVTESNTDYWQKTHYGFQFDNAPTFLKNVEGDFTFQTTVEFNYKELYDQAGIILYENSENWIKVSMEYHNPEFSTLGSVVTNLGYSDWAFQNTSSNTNKVHYRLSRKGSDFLIEFSLDGKNFQKMRIAHMHKKIDIAKVGVYACSPKDSSFKALFSHLTYGKCEWTQ